VSVSVSVGVSVVVFVNANLDGDGDGDVRPLFRHLASQHLAAGRRRDANRSSLDVAVAVADNAQVHDDV
jgi:hypothetical protein